MKKFFIDHFEGGYAVCQAEDKATVTIPKYKLPLDTKEGDYLVLNQDGMYIKDLNPPKGKKRNKKDKLSDLFNT